MKQQAEWLLWFVLLVVSWELQTVAAPYRGMDLYPLAVPEELDSVIEPDPNFGGNPVAPGQVVGNSGSGAAWTWDAFDGAGDLLPAAFVQPAGFSTDRVVYSTDGISQVGYADYSAHDFHAVLWGGPEGIAVDLHPSSMGFLNSVAIGVQGNQQVGYGQFPFSPNIQHALLWTGAAQSAVDLHPSLEEDVASYSRAVATDGTQQVGYYFGPSGEHAILWSGTAESAIDLTPASIGNSRALGIGGGQQVGVGDYQAMVWTGTAASAVNLHPATLGELERSAALGTDGVHQVGVVDFWELGVSHAHLWNGTAASAVNLHLLLPSGFNSSIAYTLDSQGVIYGLAKTDDFQWHSVIWTPVPEPQSVVPAATALIGSACVLHRRFTRMFGCHQ